MPKLFHHRAFLIFISAVGMVFSFPPWNLEWPIWVFLVPWFFSLTRRATWKSALVDGLWLSFFVTLGGFFWVCTVLHEFGGVPWVVAGLMFMGFAFFGQLQFLAISVLFQQVWRKGLQSRVLHFSLFIAFAYVGIDWFLPKLFTDTLGHVFHGAPRLRQNADAVGAYGLSFLVVMVNLFFFFFIRFVREKSEPSWQPVIRVLTPLASVSFGLLVLAILYGNYRLNQVREWMNSPKDQIQMAVIQANIGDFDKVAAERGVRGAADKILQTYYQLSSQALATSPRPEAVVWPETAYPSLFRAPGSSNELARDQMLERYVIVQQTPVLFGGYDRSNGKDHNAFFFLSPKFGTEESQLSIYRKHTLLLFGEYIPGAETFDWIKKAFPQVGNFGRGIGAQALEIPRREKTAVKAGPLICYEVLFPQYVIDTVRAGAEVLLNITNDSWFGPYAEPELHLALSTFRAVETRTPVFRATNTGISAHITPDGEVARRSEIDKEDILNWSVPIYEPHSTLLLKAGDWFGIFALAVLIGWLLRLSRRRTI